MAVDEASPQELRDQLTAAFTRLGLDESKALDVAGRILKADKAVQTAAEEWLATGTLPDYPKVHVYTPRSIGDRKNGSPVFAFTGLMRLMEDPKQTLSLLKHHDFNAPHDALNHGSRSDHTGLA